MSDLVVVIPVWRRTSNLARVLDAFSSTCDGRVLFVASAGDQDMLDALGDLGVAGAFDLLLLDGPGGDRGDYARKINAGYRSSDEPLIFTGADDIVPRAGWYEAATAPLGSLASPVGVVGTVDECNPRTVAGVHSTHSLVTRWYADAGACVDQTHVIYHEGYDHEYCDDELVATAMQRGAYRHAFDAHVEHRHPIHPELAVPDDETYQRGRQRTRHSRALFRQRRHLWSGIRRQPGQFAR